MSLHPTPIGEIPIETARVAKAAFPKGTLVTRLRDEFAVLFEDADFRALYPRQGQPGLAPWRLALVTVFRFFEQLSDRQAADAVRARIDWKYALGLELTDPGFHFSVLAEFRARLVAGRAEHLLLDRMLERFKERGLVKARGKQRTDSTHVLAAVRTLNRLELVGESVRAALNALAATAPDWLRAVAPPEWHARYDHRFEEARMPSTDSARERLLRTLGEDGAALLAAVDAPTAPPALRALPAVAALRQVLARYYRATTPASRRTPRTGRPPASPCCARAARASWGGRPARSSPRTSSTRATATVPARSGSATRVRWCT